MAMQFRLRTSLHFKEGISADDALAALSKGFEELESVMRMAADAPPPTYKFGIVRLEMIGNGVEYEGQLFFPS